MTISARQLLQQWPEIAQLPQLAHINPARLIADSRSLQAGDAFIALKGMQVDARQFIEVALEQDVSLVLAEADGEQARADFLQQAPVIHLPRLGQQLSRIAALFYGEPSAGLSIFAVTGTNGKTTCSHLYGQLMQRLNKTVGVIGTLGYGLVGQPSLQETGFTTPDAIALQSILADLKKSGASVIAMEASSHSLDQGRLNAVAIKGALFTNLSRDHLDYHGDMAAYAACKWRLFESAGLGYAVINIDDAQGALWAKSYSGKGRLVTYSVSNASADIYATSTEFSETGIQARLVTPAGEIDINSQLIGQFNLSNLLGVISAALAESNSLASVAEQVPYLTPVTGRMQKIEGPEFAPAVIVDYAHTPDGLQQALQALKGHGGQKIWCIFGCGGDRDAGKRPQMAAIAERMADRVVVTNDNPRTESPENILADIKTGFLQPEKVIVQLDRERAICETIAGAGAHDLILVAGKGHEDYQILGRERVHFSDIEICQKALQQQVLH